MKRLGLIGEDQTDIDTLRVLAERLHPGRLRFMGASLKGRGNLKKLGPFVRDQARQCAAVLIVVDLDDDDPARLAAALVQATPSIERPLHHCIAVQEIEAWFFADQKLLNSVGDELRAAHEPERLKNPKESLMRASRKRHGRSRYSTNTNADLARQLDLESCKARCAAFRGLVEFLARVP